MRESFGHGLISPPDFRHQPSNPIHDFDRPQHGHHANQQTGTESPTVQAPTLNPIHGFDRPKRRHHACHQIGGNRTFLPRTIPATCGHTRRLTRGSCISGAAQTAGPLYRPTSAAALALQPGSPIPPSAKMGVTLAAGTQNVAIALQLAAVVPLLQHFPPHACHSE